VGGGDLGLGGIDVRDRCARSELRDDVLEKDASLPLIGAIGEPEELDPVGLHGPSLAAGQRNAAEDDGDWKDDLAGRRALS